MSCLRVAQVIDGLYIGGAERLLVVFAEAAPRFEMDPTVIPLHIYPETPFLDQLNAIKTPVVEFRGRNMADLGRFWRLVSYLRHGKFDVVHVHLTYAIILGSLAAKLAGIPVVATLHNIRADRWSRLEIFALRHWVDSVVTVGPEVAGAYRPLLPRKRMETILNAVNSPSDITLAKRRELRQEMGANHADMLILAVGRLFPQKGYDDLLSAMAILRQKGVAVRLAIAGIGKLQSHLSSRVEELDLNGVVRFLGSRADVPVLMAASDIFVNASHWEGLPVAILEAMAARLPIVATQVGDVPKVLAENCGILVPPERPGMLAEALHKLCADPELRNTLGRNAGNYVAQHHSPDAWMMQLSRIYRSVGDSNLQSHGR